MRCRANLEQGTPIPGVRHIQRGGAVNALQAHEGYRSAVPFDGLFGKRPYTGMVAPESPGLRDELRESTDRHVQNRATCGAGKMGSEFVAQRSSGRHSDPVLRPRSTAITSDPAVRVPANPGTVPVGHETVECGFVSANAPEEFHRPVAGCVSSIPMAIGTAKRHVSIVAAEASNELPLAASTAPDPSSLPWIERCRADSPFGQCWCRFSSQLLAKLLLATV